MRWGGPHRCRATGLTCIRASRAFSSAAMPGPFRYRRKSGTGCSTSSPRSPRHGARAGWSRPRAARRIMSPTSIAELAKDESVVARFIDYRTQGPGTLPEVFGKAEVILCTEDSSTMISEAVSARLPVVGVAPRAHRFTDEERSYREFLIAQWLVPRAADRRADARRLRPRAVRDRAASREPARCACRQAQSSACRKLFGR